MRTIVFFAFLLSVVFILSAALSAQDHCIIVKSADFIDNNTCWIAGNDCLKRTQDGGNTWSHIQLNGSWDMHYIDFLDDKIGWAVRDKSLYKTENGGNDWLMQKTYSMISQGPSLPFVVNDSIVYVTGKIEILKTMDGGKSWEVIYLFMNLTSLWFFNENCGIVTGTSGSNNTCTIKKTFDGGNSWKSETADIPGIYNLNFINDSVGYFILTREEPGLQNPGPLYITRDRINSFKKLLSNVVSFSALENGTIMALVEGSQAMRILKKAENQKDWEVICDDLPEMDIIKFLDENTGWVIGDEMLLKTDDGGDTWIDLSLKAHFRECIPPEIFIAPSLYINPDTITAMSTEDGKIYLVPANTEKDLLIIRASAIDSADVAANDTVGFQSSILDDGSYCMYAVDTSWNISDPGVFVVKIVDQSYLSNIVILNDLAFLNALIDEGVDTDGDGLISYEEAAAVKQLSLSNEGIASLKGLEAFIYLGYLNCNYNKLASLDVSKNPKLRRLYCAYNQLKNLDFTKHYSLDYLECQYNELTSLNLTYTTSLNKLLCDHNQITSLDASTTPMVELYCYNNPLASLNVSKCRSLSVLDCNSSKLTSLDVSKNEYLERLDISNIPDLYQVCVWEMPFPPENVFVFTEGSPNVYFTSGCATGLHEFTKGEFNIYPNPTNNLLTIETGIAGQYSIKITSLNGQLLFKSKIEGPTNQIDLSSFEKGLYFITIRSRDYVRTEKIIKL